MSITQAAVQLSKIVSFVTSSSALSGTSITIPASAQEGDLCVITQGAGAAFSAPTAVTPTGFTNVVNVSGTSGVVGVRTMVSYKVLVSGDPGTSRTVMSGVSCCMIFRPSNFTISTVSNSTPSQQVTTAAPTAQTITLGAASVARPTIAIAYFSADGGTGTISTSGGPTFTQITLGSSDAVRYAVLNDNEAATDTTVTKSDNGINSLASFSFQLT